MTGAHRSLRPLREAAHRDIVERHLCIETPYSPSVFPEPHTELGLLACDQVRHEATDGLERSNAHHRNSATGLGVTKRRIPFDVAKVVVDARIWEALPEPASRSGVLSILVEEARSVFNPPSDELAVPVDQLRVVQLRGDPGQSLDPCVPRARRREWYGRIELDDIGSHRPRQLYTSVRGTRIDIHHVRHLLGERVQADPQPLSLVLADGDSANRRAGSYAHISNPFTKVLLRRKSRQKWGGSSFPFRWMTDRTRKVV